MAVFSYVQSNLSISSTSLAYSSNNTAGNILVAYLGTFGGGVPSTLTDSQSNVWYQVWPLLFGSSQTAIYVAIAGSSGANTVSASGLSGDYGFTILEYSSTSANFSICGANPSTATGNSFSVSSGSKLTLPAGFEYLAITCAFDQHSGHAWTSSAATIRQQSGSISGGESIVVADQDVSSGAISLASPYTNTFSGAGSGNMGGGTLFLVALSGGGGSASGGSYVFG